MFKHLLRITPIMLILFIFPLTGLAQDYTAVSSGKCLQCHGAEMLISSNDFADSAHGPDGCTSCHTGITDLRAHELGKLKSGPVRCDRCHQDMVARYSPGVHSSNNVRCYDCHSNIHTLSLWKGDKRKVVRICSQCHDAQFAYRKSVHGQSVFSL
jgi:ssDNA-binding Zn-finger/Zn-ribbon topoisomerase 1